MKQQRAKRQTWRSRFGLRRLIENETDNDLKAVVNAFTQEAQSANLRRYPFNFNGNFTRKRIEQGRDILELLLHGNNPSFFKVYTSRSVYRNTDGGRHVYFDIEIYSPAGYYYGGVLSYMVGPEREVKAPPFSLPQEAN